MTREELKREILSLEGSNWLLELATGTGKSKLALDKLRHISNGGRKSDTLVIVVHRLVHKQNWTDELIKWWSKCPMMVTFVTYVSFPKYCNTHKHVDYAIFDECHHLSDKCIEAIRSSGVKIQHSILCSATVGNKKRDILSRVFPELNCYKRDLREVIDDDILADPRVYLWPLELRTDLPTETIMFNSKSKERVIECCWKDRWKFMKQKKYPVRIFCTQRQYLSYIDSQIDYWKRRSYCTGSQIAKNKWLRLCNDRLKWLSEKKVGYMYNLLCYLKDYRTLTFCNNIEQTEKLGEYCINSKNASSVQNYEDFNNGKIDHITACNMLNEGMNLVNCQIGIYANLNSSETIIKQRMGRLLRHPNPVLIVPYFTNSRDEEIVKTMLEDYNPELVTKINKIEDIKV